MNTITPSVVSPFSIPYLDAWAQNAYSIQGTAAETILGCIPLVGPVVNNLMHYHIKKMVIQMSKPLDQNQLAQHVEKLNRSKVLALVATSITAIALTILSIFVLGPLGAILVALPVIGFTITAYTLHKNRMLLQELKQGTAQEPIIVH